MFLNLETQEVDKVLSILQRMPWVEVDFLIQKILRQANSSGFQALLSKVEAHEPPSSSPAP
jgi:hypothetical protein